MSRWDGINSFFKQLDDGINQAAKELDKFMKEVVGGIRPREREYEGPVIIRNSCPTEAHLQFMDSALGGTTTKHLQVIAAGATWNYDPGKSKEFDFLLCVNGGTAKAHVCRNATYSVHENPEHKSDTLRGKHQIVEEKPPARVRSEKLASTQGLSFSFSASGWLFVYQLGCAECLQNHGIARNPYVRVSGASGGALTVATMMYGCDMPALRDFMKKCAQDVFDNYSHSVQLRRFLLQACEQVVRDGSYLHPAFQEGRVEIAVSESAVGSGLLPSVLLGKAQNKRAKQFGDSADVVIALLASSSMGISGAPFTMKNEDGKDVRVADGAFTQFMPVIDKNSIKVKPFGDGIGLFGGQADVQPTEWVPGNMALAPPTSTFIGHLYECGYQDMEAWLDLHLAEHLKKCTESVSSSERPEQSGNLPSIEFTCKDDGMLWYDKVLRSVPLRWKEQLSAKTFQAKAASVPLRQGWLEMQVNGVSNDSLNEVKKHGKLWIVLRAANLSWRPEQESSDAAPGVQETNAQESQGAISLQMLEQVDINPQDQTELLIATDDLQAIRLKAASPAEAQAWKSAIKDAICKWRAEVTATDDAVSPGDVDPLVSADHKLSKDQKNKKCCALL